MNNAFVLISLFVVSISSQRCLQRGFTVQETLPLTSCSESLCPECDYCSDENEENASISTKIDAENGTLRVYYKLDLAKNYSELLIRLQVSEELNAANCKSADPVFLTTPFKIHSSKKISLRWEPENSTSLETPCCKTLELNFKYIFTGCYFVQVFPYKDSNIQKPIEDCPKMYETEYVKEHLMLMTPKLSPQYFSDSVQIAMYIRGEPAYLLVTLHSEKIRNLPFHGKKTCDRFSTEYACCYNHMYKTSTGGFECQSKMKSPETNCSVVNSKEGKKEVKCIFSQIKPGNYCISIRFDDERCEPGTIWETNINGCLWRLRYEAKKSSPVALIEEDRVGAVMIPAGDFSGYIFAVLSVSIVVLMLLILVMYKKYSSASLVRPTDRITTLREHLGLVKLEQPSVLLLYPRDSNTFMNAMAQFRKVLRRANCKVYDCWDPAMESEVIKSPHAWIQLHALDKTTRVIIVASQCSLLLERSVLGNSKVEYLYPSPFDDLFMYGIRCLNETTFTDCYEKMFVVRLRGPDDTSEVASLTYINPLTVFSLPLHLEKLILGLLSVDGSHYSIATDFPEVRAFAKAVQENSWFVKHNPNYLSSLVCSCPGPEEDLLQFS